MLVILSKRNTEANDVPQDYAEATGFSRKRKAGTSEDQKPYQVS